MLTAQVLLAMRLRQMLADSLKTLLTVRRTNPQPLDDNPRLVMFLQDRRAHPVRGGASYTHMLTARVLTVTGSPPINCPNKACKPFPSLLKSHSLTVHSAVLHCKFFRTLIKCFKLACFLKLFSIPNIFSEQYTV